MNQDIKTSTLLLVIVIFGSLLFAKFWASSASKSIMVYSYLHQHPDGSSYIKLSDKLLGFDVHGKHQATIDLAEFNVQENNTSDFAFFSNGDLLLKRKAQEKNLIKNLQRYFRFTNPTDKFSANSKGDGLFRCNPLTLICTAFTQQAINTNEAFALAIDWETDRVFIADSSRHQIYMYSKEGLELDTAKGFKFPNQIEVANSQLYVADTNHHRLVSFDISNDEIGAIKENFDTRTIESRKLNETWPSAFLLKDNQRWIINNKNGMNFGGIYVFDDSGKYIKKLKLAVEADPFAMIHIGEQVLISDFSLDRIYLFNLEGEPQGNFNPPALQQIQKHLTQQRSHYQWINNLFSVLFAVCLSAGFMFALYQQNRMKKNALAEPGPIIDTLQKTIDEPVLHWIKTSTRFKIMGTLLLIFCAFIYLLLTLASWLQGLSMYEFFTQTWKIQLIIFYICTTLILQFRRKIGITQNTVIIYPLIGSKTVCPKNEIISNDIHIVFGKAIFQINQLYKRFTANDIENHLYPAIKQGKQVNRIEMQAILAGNKNVRIAQTFIIVMLMGLFVYHGIFSNI